MPDLGGPRAQEKSAASYFCLAKPAPTKASSQRASSPPVREKMNFSEDPVGAKKPAPQRLGKNVEWQPPQRKNPAKILPSSPPSPS
ncbi:hypothetical protein LIER_00472 [Lithospermum erythrorhizon]|uniref:Uncharacterized protein n=1 Tax=Lithospermum erythrorhizon TaxID=34254 RepID=A0AAV3NIK7_LITER